ncbi:MAG: recombinase family protein, partial [Moraxellaceae bacterium]|nr:recombinase family protein [Moraxellaceae bacterium]
MKIGYARVSTDDQNLDLQHDELKRAGCENIYSEHISSTKAERPQLQACLKALRHDDVLVIWRLDRLGRNLKEL